MNKLTPFLLLLSIAYLFGCTADKSIEVEPPSQTNQSSNEDGISEAIPSKGKIGYSAMSLKNPFFVVISKRLSTGAVGDG